MNIINLQNKTTAEKGKIELFWFEDKSIGLQRTLFHRITIPLSSFESGLEKDTKLVKTKIVVDWLDLKLRDPLELDKLILRSSPDDDRDISIHIGGAHNPCDIKKMAINKISDKLYEIKCELDIDFEYEKVAKNETFKFKTEVELVTEVIG